MSDAAPRGGVLPPASEAHPLLVSLHMPKTAGTSFAATLRAHFGDRYRADYDMPPLQLPRGRRMLRACADVRRIRRDGVAADCVHGHFLPATYRFGLRKRPAAYVTWLRDPVERILSHYHYWRRGYAGDDPRQPLRNRMLEQNWSLERFALGPELRNVYHQYLWNFPPSRFDFIGITEHYAEDIQRLSHQHLGCEAVLACEQVNPERGDARYALEPGLRRRIEQHHARDVALYRWALQRRNGRVS